MSSSTLMVPYSRRGPMPRARQVARSCCPSCASKASTRSGLGALGAADPWVQFNRQVTAAVRRAAARRGTLAGLGANVQKAAGAASGAASGAEAGMSACGPYCAAAGAVIGAALSLLHKNYFNVAQSDALCQQVLQLWQQYQQVAGTVPGRALGWQALQVVFHGAVGAGLFPGNNMHLSFHNGTLKCAGHGDWVDAFLGNAPCGAHNCLPDALAQYKQHPAPAGTPAAVYFVDSILLPMNARDAIPWITNGAENPEVHQLLYDLADAYLAANVSGTQPYIAHAAVSSPGAAAPAAAASAVVAPGVTYHPTDQVAAPASSSGSTAVTVTGTTSAGGPVVPTDQTNGLISQLLQQGQSAQQAYQAALQSLQANGVNTASPAVQGQVAGAVQAMSAGSGATLSSPWVLVAGGGLLLAGVFLMSRGGRRR